MPLKHVKLPSSHLKLYYRVTDTGLALGSSRAVNLHWLIIVLLLIMVYTFLPFTLDQNQKKIQTELILNTSIFIVLLEILWLFLSSRIIFTLVD